MTESGYDPVIVIDWLTSEGAVRIDGRHTMLRGRLLEDTHRDTIDRWLLAATYDDEFLVPLGRFDEILCHYDIHLSEFETWAQEVYGTDGYQVLTDSE